MAFFTFNKNSVKIILNNRIFIEQINRYIKRYRNKCRRFALRSSSICAIYNF